MHSDDPEISVRELAGEFVVFDARRNKVHSLNPTATRVWRLCDGETSIDEMVENVSLHLAVERNEARTITLMALERLEKAHLLSDGWSLAGSRIPTRREALRAMAGIGAATLLPVIYSLLAPEAVQAQSVVVCGGPCHPSQGQNCIAGCVCSKPHGRGVCIPA